MTKSLRQRITESRLLLQNPYAYLNDRGTFGEEDEVFAMSAVAADEIAADRLRLKNQYAHVDGNGLFSAAVKNPPPAFSSVGQELRGRYASLRSKRRNRRYLHQDIEAKAAELQRLIWQHRNEIWPEGAPENPIDMLDPAVAFQLLGFDYEIADGLGHYFVGNRQIEAAGLIDDSTMEVRTSRRFPFEFQNFTAAHELGHALLHDARGLHRDRPLDGSLPVREPVETEANKFASCFLMPAKLVKQHFSRLFGTDRFVLDEDARFALSRGGVDMSKCQTLRDLARILAGAQNYNGIRFQSLATQFRVSVEAMAIRIEELDLVGA